MKELFKQICLDEYNNFYERIVEYFVKELTQKEFHNSKPSIQEYVEAIAKKSMETFIANDFTVTKVHGSVSYLQGLTFDNFETTIYNIKEKKLNVIVMPFRNYITISEREMIDLLRWDYSTFFEYNKEYYEIDEISKNEILNADLDILLGIETLDFNKNVFLEYNDNGEEILSFYELLVELYGKNQKTENYKNILFEYLNKVVNLIELTLSKVYKDNAEKFNEIALTLITDRIRNFQRDEIRIILDYFDKKVNNPRILKMILSFLYTKKSIDYNNDIDFLDFTFIAIEIFKLVESVFNDLLNIYWSNKKIIDSNDKVIDFSSSGLTFGEMKQFFYYIDNEIQKHINTKTKYSKNLLKKLSKWIKEDRNGYTHKHIIENYSQVENSVQTALELICDLILILTK